MRDRIETSLVLRPSFCQEKIISFNIFKDSLVMTEKHLNCREVHKFGAHGTNGVYIIRAAELSRKVFYTDQVI